MAIKSAIYQFKGMNRDLSNMNVSEQFAYEIRNMRITPNKDNTLLSISTINGHKPKKLTLKGIPIGHVVVNNLWIIFCSGENVDLSNSVITEQEGLSITIDYTESESGESTNINSIKYDYIYKIVKTSDSIFYYYSYGEFNFSKDNPIEAIAFVENEELKKIYWTDGVNQPRFISVDDIKNRKEINVQDIEFVPNIRNNTSEQLTIVSNPTLGVFPSGTVQYAFTYVNYYGQLSNIFKISSVYYNTSKDNGLSVNLYSNNSYVITLSNLNNTDYLYVRIYSIVRPTPQGIPTVKVLQDIKLNDTEIVFTDRNTVGYTIDPSELFYVGGELIVVGTMTQKDNTLFLGNIKKINNVLSSETRNIFKSCTINYYLDDDKVVPEVASAKVYEKAFLLRSPSSKITTFKHGEYYRFGVLLQYPSGKWSEPIYIKDKKCDVHQNTELKWSANLNDFTSHEHKMVSAKCIIDDSKIKSLQQQGFLKIRPVIVYPDLLNRTVLCQGYLCPTVYNAGQRLNTSSGTWVLSSWFARPYCKNDYSPTNNHVSGTEYEDTEGALLEFRHNAYIGGKYTRHQELQNADRTPLSNSNSGFAFVIPDDNSMSLDEWKELHSHLFFVDSSIVTMHSPELEFDETIKTLDLTPYKFRIVGFVPLTGSAGDIDIITSKMPKGYFKEENNNAIGEGNFKYTGFIHKSLTNNNYSKKGSRILCSGVFYRDWFFYDVKNRTYPLPYYGIGEFNPDNFSGYTDFGQSENNSANFTSLIGPMGFHIFPFLCSGDIYPYDEVGTYNTLLYKKLSNVRYSYGSIYFNLPKEAIPTNSISLFNYDLDIPLYIKDYANRSVIYEGNVDRVITSKFLDKSDYTVKNGTTRYECPHVGISVSIVMPLRALNLDEVSKLPYSACIESSIQTDPMIMRYKSSPHVVISIKGSEITLNTLPIRNNKNQYGCSVWNGSRPFWEVGKSGNNYLKNQNPVYNFSEEDFKNLDCNGLWIGELYQDIGENELFGGNTTQAIENNRWTVAGEDRVLDGEEIVLNYTEGDTYYQRYDNLKTYPWSLEEVNGITEVISFMVETRINMDGRCDNNKPEKPLFHIFPDNFNIINNNYTLKNDYFGYYGTNYDKLLITKYPSTITWSKTKVPGELTDSWLNVTLASTLDLDGTNGNVNSLQNYNGDIVAFLDKAISKILYNEQVQISTQQGLPIELANSGKVTGYRNISNNIGCRNKWSICNTPNGLYFLDSLNKDLYKYGEGLENLSYKNGFTTYLKSINNIEEDWNVISGNSIKTSYDPINKEVLFSTTVNKDNKNILETLVYSELLQLFTSFYDYNSYYVATLLGDSYILEPALDNALSVGYTLSEYQTSSNYSTFSGIKKPYYIEFISNPEPLNDKIFSAIEFRSDSYNAKGEIEHFKTFNKLTVNNEYLDNSIDLEYSNYGLSSLRKRFRIWNIKMPRDKNYNYDRIRNTWTKIKLESTENNDNLNTVLHDITVHYSV